MGHAVAPIGLVPVPAGDPNSTGRRVRFGLEGEGDLRRGFEAAEIVGVEQIAQAAEVGVGVNEAGDDGSALGVNALRAGADVGRHLFADINKLAILHGEGYRFGLFRVHGIDDGIFHDQIRELGVGQVGQKERKRH